ncbi:MAG: Smr/MutS family protein [Helicobacteraceae bacterium]|jgi:DNA mismatch repair protein MutS2|nr:Smr/MutS family protein [Helicobacteraceae bacterium]
MEQLIKRLDLDEHFAALSAFFARAKPFAVDGDERQNALFLREMETLELPALPRVQNLDSAIARLYKRGAIRLDELYDFVRIARFFEGLKLRDYQGKIGEWIGAIEIAKPLKNLTAAFDYDGEVTASAELARLKGAIEEQKKRCSRLIATLSSDPKLSPYLVDRQTHIANGEESLLLRGGFNRVLAGRVVDRTQAGFFYVAPRALSDAKRAIEDLENEKLEAIAALEREYSAPLFEQTKHLRFINASFDRFDSLAARIAFAKSQNLAIAQPSATRNISLSNFCHPALKNPKPISADFSKPIIIVTGVNAGGKTMLLKSALSAVLMAKYLVPMKIDAHKSVLGRFKGIEAILSDPQNAKNDISTFAGRMAQFAALFGGENLLIGADEIELGTDGDEAASLFKVMLERLSDRGSCVIATTHHKRLAALMAKDDRVELIAALYDEKAQKPSFNFMRGTIGRSYAFETALRYGVPHTIVGAAKTEYGEDRERLNDLIERSSDLEREMRLKIAKLDEEEAELARRKNALIAEREAQKAEYEKLRGELEREYAAAIDAAKQAARAENEADRHRALNAANALKTAIAKPAIEIETERFKEGDSVRYLGAIGVIASIKAGRALVESDGGRIYAALSDLKRAPIVPAPKPKIAIERPQTASFRLDLHGLRAAEALEKLDKFLSDALLAGFDEAIVIHGVGSGKLAYAVREALKIHPRVKAFADAPPNMGGIGATIVKF